MKASKRKHLIKKFVNEKNVRKSIRCEFISLSNIYNGDFCKNHKRLKVTIFAKSSSIDIWQGTEWAPENRCSDNNDNEIGHEYCLFYQTYNRSLEKVSILVNFLYYFCIVCNITRRSKGAFRNLLNTYDRV